MSLFETAKARVLSEKRDPSKSIRLCYGYVKDAMVAYYGIERAKITGGSAIDAIVCLPKLGWVNMIDQYPTQFDAPADSILVYLDNKIHGHIEIASGGESKQDKWFCSDFFYCLAKMDMVNGPISRKLNRSLIGVFIKG
jgi:hypothetical protein